MNDFVAGYHFVLDNWAHPSFRGLQALGKSIFQLTIDHIVLSAEAVAIALLIGVPIGLFLGHIHRFSFLAINVSNLGRALPSLGIISIFLPFTGISQTTVIIALVILGAPPILTNTYVAIEQVDPDTVDAAKGLGLRPWQVLLRVELPLALPVIFAGIRTATVFIVATATLSGFFGGGGLGDIIANVASFGTVGLLGASYVLIVLAFLVPDHLPGHRIPRHTTRPPPAPAAARRSAGPGSPGHRPARRESEPRSPRPRRSPNPLAPDNCPEAIPGLPARLRPRRVRGSLAREARSTWMKKITMFSRGAVVAATAAALALTACGSSGGSSSPGNGTSSGNGGSSTANSQPGKGKPKITLGTKNFSEEFLLGQLYKQALEAKGYTVDYKENIGASEVTDKAMTSGKIDMYPEYTGVIYSNADLANLGNSPKSAETTYQKAQEVGEQPRLLRAAADPVPGRGRLSRSPRPTPTSTTSRPSVT